MIVGFSTYGTGGGYAPVRYLTSLTNPDKSLRCHPDGTPAPPQVLRGNPQSVQHLIDTMPFKYKYTSGVLSFAPGEIITPEMEEAIMDEFEEAAFCGLSADRYSILWVRHTHAGHHEIHFLVPRIELSTMRSLNIRPPGSKAGDLFDSFRSMINARYALSDPDDPARAQDVTMSNVFAKLGVYDDAQPRQADQPLAAVLRERVRQGLEAGEKLKGTTRLREDLRQGINAYVRAEVEAGRIANREDVERYLKQAGLTLTRETGKAVTVLVPGTLDYFKGLSPDEAQKHAVIRLKGGLYSRDDFDPGKKAERPKRYARPEPEREAQFAEKLERLKDLRRAYHLKRYGTRDLPEPRPIERHDPSPQIEPLDDYVQRVMGEHAIPAGDEAAPSSRRQRRAKAAREEEEALEQEEHHRRHL